MTPRRLVTIITAAATPHIGADCAGELARNVAQCVVGGIPLDKALTSCVAHRRRTPEYGWAPLTGRQATSLLAAIMDAVLEEEEPESLLAKWAKRIARDIDPEVAGQIGRAER